MIGLGVLDFVPRSALLGAALLATAAAGVNQVRLHGLQLELARLHVTLATERQLAADAGRAAAEQFRAQERRVETRNQETTDATVQATTAAAAADARAAAAVRELRLRAAALAPRCHPGPAAAAAASDRDAATGAGNLCADVLGRLAEAGQLVAATADRSLIAGTDCQRRYEALGAH